jgi:hypothetical protein
MPHKIMVLLCWTPSSMVDDDDNDNGITSTINFESDENARKSNIQAIHKDVPPITTENTMRTIVNKMGTWRKNWKLNFARSTHAAAAASVQYIGSVS